MHGPEQFDDPDVRKVLNETLKDVLNTGGWGASQWDAVINTLNEEFGIDTDLLLLAQTAPCLVDVFLIGALKGGGLISKQTQETIIEIVSKLVTIALHADKGEDVAINQLRVLHKIAHPFSYELPATVIKNLADSYHTSPHLARAWDVRSLMLELSYVVEPTCFDRSVAEGTVRLAPRAKHEHPIREKAEKFINVHSTLKSLAISIYLDQLDAEGITLNAGQIKADLRKLKEWESVNLKEAPYTLPLWERAGEYPGASIPPIPIYSDGWKKLWRRGG